MMDGIRINMKIQVLELKKLPKVIKTGEDIVNWMRFFNGKNKEEFQQMAKESIYLDEAYYALKKNTAGKLAKKMGSN